jgi:hypothetical protein
MSVPMDAIFQTKYDEFASALTDVFPELAVDITASMALSPQERISRFKTEVLPAAGNTKRDPATFPGMVLPGVFINETLWDSVSEKTKEAINKFINLLTFTFVMKEGGSEDFGGDAFRQWADMFMDQWRGKLDRADFDSFTKRFADLFGSGGDRLPPFPEKLRRGKLVKLAEEIVKELTPEEFGLDPDVVKQCEADPSKAFEILMETTMNNPGKLQNAMKRIIKRLQEKFQRGEFRPQELAAEAEEMMKEFSENPAFVEMMEQMRKTFGFEDMSSARAAGQEPSARMKIVQERLRRKQAQNAAAKATSTASATTPAVPAVDPVGDIDEFVSILMNTGAKDNTKNKKGKK